jgi:hypothetical protein
MKIFLPALFLLIGCASTHQLSLSEVEPGKNQSALLVKILNYEQGQVECTILDFKQGGAGTPTFPKKSTKTFLISQFLLSNFEKQEGRSLDQVLKKEQQVILLTEQNRSTLAITNIIYQ